MKPFAHVSNSILLVLESAGGCCEYISNVLESLEGCCEDSLNVFQLKYQWFWNQQYDGPPELFTMYACIFMSCIDYSHDWIGTNRNKLVRARVDFEAKHGMPPHPKELLKMCNASLVL